MSIQGKILRELQSAPRSRKELKRKIGNDKKVSRGLEILLEKRQIARRGDLYFLIQKKRKGIPCTIVKLGKTFGFAHPLDESGDIFVPGRSLQGAMPGDQVEIQLFDRPRVPGSREGEVVAIVSMRQEFVGTVERQGAGKLVLVPDDAPETPLRIRRSCQQDVEPGERAAALLSRRADNHEDHRVEIVRVFGSGESAKDCARSILYSQDLQKQFPPEVLKEAQSLENFEIPAVELVERLDLRDWDIFTIDGASTKDIDDAISLETTDKGWRLGVHIADVSWFVAAHSELDREAYRRGTSVYYADDVIPMLPKELSNGVCSLNEGVDRLAFSCLMELDKQGGLQSYRFVKTIIHSRVKGVYTELNQLLAGEADQTIQQKYTMVLPQLVEMQKLHQVLNARRKKRGGMEIESGESKLLLDEQGKCIGVCKAQRGQTEEMIESFMLMANTCAAIEGKSKGLPFVYRVHTAPDEERIERLKTMLKAAGVNVSLSDQPSPLEFSRLLDKTKGTGLERAVHTAVLRAMSKAKYEPLPKGHFSLALEDYAHFTSPIRRYPDLAIHRILSAALEGHKNLDKRFGQFAEKASLQSSQRELVAMQTERTIEDCYKAEYMKTKVGQVFDGVVSGVTNHGLYVELPDTVEGLVHITRLSRGEPIVVDGIAIDDPFTGRNWHLGDAVKVKCIAASVSTGKIDFDLA